MQEKLDLRIELDQLISGLNGVLAARTVLDDHDEIIEVHVLSDLNKAPKQLVRDIQSAVMASMGLEIDYKLISVAQVNKNVVVPVHGSHTRLMIRKIMISLDSRNLETTVILGYGDKTFEGSSKGPLSGKNRVYSAAGACIEALKKHLGQAYNLNLLDLQKTTLAGNSCYAAALSFVEPFSETVVYGIAPITSPETEIQSVVMAVLSAMNRPISRPRKHSEQAGSSF